MTVGMQGVSRWSPGWLGARVDASGVTFRVFTTVTDRVSVRLFEADGNSARQTVPLAAQGDGWFAATVTDAATGTLYKFVLGDAEWPDPYARALPFGVHGPAEVVADTFAWTHGDGIHRPLAEHVFYELHVGTFTREGTYAAAVEKLLELAKLGVTAVELLPVCAFAGTRGWGYDGVMHFAPFAPYGTPDDLRRFVDAAHGLGLSVFLDVVYNHFGPDGSYLGVYDPAYFDRARPTRWGDAPDFANPLARAYVLSSARMWLESYRFDGLRLDATHAIHDEAHLRSGGASLHVLRELSDLAHAMTPRRLVIAEDDMNDPRLVHDHQMDGIWVDDFQRQLHATLTLASDGNFAAYTPGAEGLAAAIMGGWLFTGQHFSPWSVKRGAPATGLPASAFVYGIQNHDHVGNRPCGDRMCHHASMDAYAAAAALLLFLPMTPLLFQGQEWAASTPFLYFTDHHPGLGARIREGRKDEFRGFPGWDGEPPDPQALATFTSSKLVWEERVAAPHAEILALYTDLLTLRRQDPVLREGSRERLRAYASRDLLVVHRWSGSDTRMLIVSFADEPRDLTGLEELEGASVLLATNKTTTAHAIPARAAAIFTTSRLR